MDQGTSSDQTLVVFGGSEVDESCDYDVDCDGNIVQDNPLIPRSINSQTNVLTEPRGLNFVICEKGIKRITKLCWMSSYVLAYPAWSGQGTDYFAPG